MLKVRTAWYPFNMAATDIDLETVREEVTNNAMDMYHDIAKSNEQMRSILDLSMTGFNDMSVEEHAGVYLALNCIDLGALIHIMPMMNQIIHGQHWQGDRLRKLLDHEEEVMKYVDSLE